MRWHYIWTPHSIQIDNLRPLRYSRRRGPPRWKNSSSQMREYRWLCCAVEPEFLISQREGCSVNLLTNKSKFRKSRTFFAYNSCTIGVDSRLKRCKRQDRRSARRSISRAIQSKTLTCAVRHHRRTQILSENKRQRSWWKQWTSMKAPPTPHRYLHQIVPW